jgi:hypothetical protein
MKTPKDPLDDLPPSVRARQRRLQDILATLPPERLARVEARAFELKREIEEQPKTK